MALGKLRPLRQHHNRRIARTIVVKSWITIHGVSLRDGVFL
ncbi:hypothetical protein A3768_2970 [Ralstonia solanacearum]|nr:hypothetical protein F504_705 [Ralstonia pseudosolanacearum FQY_4]ANH34099.1 hypothetical protein A3768_2970 [Ralstonia solanacearum]